MAFRRRAAFLLAAALSIVCFGGSARAQSSYDLPGLAEAVRRYEASFVKKRFKFTTAIPL